MVLLVIPSCIPLYVCGCVFDGACKRRQPVKVGFSRNLWDLLCEIVSTGMLWPCMTKKLKLLSLENAKPQQIPLCCDLYCYAMN